MRTIPGISTLRQRSDAVTEVKCPTNCGATVIRLAADEGVSLTSRGMAPDRTEAGQCQCGAEFRIPIYKERQ